VKWGAPYGDAWIESQEEIKRFLIEQISRLPKAETVAFLRSQGIAFYKRDNGDLVVWLDGQGSRERSSVNHLEESLATALAAVMANMPRDQPVLVPPERETIAQMARVAMAVYLSTVKHPVIYERTQPGDPLEPPPIFPTRGCTVRIGRVRRVARSTATQFGAVIAGDSWVCAENVSGSL